MSWLQDRKTIADSYKELIDHNNSMLFVKMKENHEEIKDVYPLINFTIERITTVWFLTINDLVWDADIIDRTVLESLIKLMFISNVDGEERSKRLHEFWTDLSEINSLKQSEQAKKNLKEFSDEISQLAFSPLVLEETIEKELRAKWNRSERSRMSQKWSFSEILKSLLLNYRGKSFEMLIGLAHEYRIASHISHGDETGIGIIDERALRPENERNIAHQGHFIKLLSNCLAYATWTSLLVMDFLKEDQKQFMSNITKARRTEELEKKYQGQVFNDPDYDKYRKNDRV
jgi:hypothetical protein